jgi:superfamily II DNA or RNA helicase
MLIEGVDDPTCNMAALYEPFENVRMLVQQVGRLVRQLGKIGAADGVSLVTRSVPVSPFWRLWMRPVSSHGLSSTEPCFVSG